jgi:hypothetical protein
MAITLQVGKGAKGAVGAETSPDGESSRNSRAAEHSPEEVLCAPGNPATCPGPGD